MNRARQDSITTEIMEIVGGAEALRGSTGIDDVDITLLLQNALGAASSAQANLVAGRSATGEK